MKDHSRII